jgi:hypothetical protein
MKNSTKKVSILLKTLLAGLFLTSSLVACSDKDEPLILPESSVSVTQASYDAAALDLFVNKEKVNKADFKFTNTTGYLRILSGKSNITLKEAGKADTLKTSEIDFKESKAYSLFVVNMVADVDYLLIEDNLSAPKEGEAKLRFINLSPGSAKLDISVKDAENNLFENVEYKTASNFKEVSPKTYTFEIRQAGSDALLFSLEDVKIEKGKTYTIWSKGIKDGADNAKFGAQVIVNK